MNMNICQTDWPELTGARETQKFDMKNMSEHSNNSAQPKNLSPIFHNQYIGIYIYSIDVCLCLCVSLCVCVNVCVCVCVCVCVRSSVRSTAPHQGQIYFTKADPHLSNAAERNARRFVKIMLLENSPLKGAEDLAYEIFLLALRFGQADTHHLLFL